MILNIGIFRTSDLLSTKFESHNIFERFSNPNRAVYYNPKAFKKLRANTKTLLFFLKKFLEREFERVSSIHYRSDQNDW